MVAVGTRTPKAGRPIQRFCKRGHERIAKQPCKACRNLRLKWKYQGNEEYREHKKALARAHKKAFYEKNGYWQSELYDRKPKARRAVQCLAE
jgi:hypothetical protein